MFNYKRYLLIKYLKTFLRIPFCNSELLIKHQKDNINQEEKITLLKHLKLCNDCKRYLSIDGVDQYDVILSMLIEEDISNDKPSKTKEKEAAAKRNYHKVLERVKQEEARDKKRFKLFPYLFGQLESSSILKPLYVFLLLFFTVGVVLTAVNTDTNTNIPIKNKFKKAPKTIARFVVTKENLKEKLSTSRLGNPDHTYSENENIIFIFYINKPGYIYIINTNSNYKVNLAYLFNKDAPLKAGEYNFQIDGKLRSYPLRGLEGEQYFFILHSLKKVKDMDKKASSFVKRLDSNPKDIPGEISSYDYFKITVN